MFQTGLTLCGVAEASRGAKFKRAGVYHNRGPEKM